MVQERERNSRRDVRPETYGRDEHWMYRAVCLWGSSNWKKLLTQYPQRW